MYYYALKYKLHTFQFSFEDDIKEMLRYSWLVMPSARRREQWMLNHTLIT